MGDETKVEIKLIAKADLADFQRAGAELQKQDQQYAKTEQSLKKLESQAERTAAAFKKIPSSVPRVDPNSTLASAPSVKDFKSPEELRAEERRVGLETERQMRREEEERRYQRRAAAQAQADEARARRRAEQAAQFAAQERQGPSLPSQAVREASIAAAYAKRNADRKHFTDSEAASEAGISLPTGLLSTGVKGALGAGAAALAGVAAVAGKSLHEFAQAQDAVSGLNAALAQNAQLTQKTSQEYQELAASLSQATAIPTQNWVEVLTRLTQFGANESNIKATSEAVKNLAGVLGGDIQQAANLMGRALAGDFEQLHRYGIAVNENATQTEKLKAVMEQAAKIGGGQMEARAQTLSGQFKNLKIAVSNVFENFGGMIARSGILQRFLRGVEEDLTKLANRMGGTIPIAGNLNNALETSSRRLAEVQTNAAAAAREFNSVESQSRRATEQFNRQATAAQNLLRAQDELAGAEQDLRIAQINAQEHAGQLTPQQAELARATARRQFEITQFQRHQAADAETQSAAERRLNQLGGNRALAEGELASARAELERQQRGQQARAELANAELAHQRAQGAADELQNTPIAVFMARGAEGGRELARLQHQTAADVNATHDQLAAARARAEQLTPNTSAQGLATATERFATASQRLTDVVTDLRNHQTALEDQISNARLSRDTRAARFGINQTRAGVETLDALGQVNRSAPATPPPNAAQLIQQFQQENQALRAGWAAYAQAVQTGQRELATAIFEDLRNLQSQVRTIATRH